MTRLTKIEAIVDDIMENITDGENLEIIRDALTYYYEENHDHI